MNSSKPRTRSTIAALVLLGLVATVCVSLGNWQLERAEQRRETQRVMEQGRASPPLELTASTSARELRDWRPASLQGHWRNDLTVLLDNRNHAGRPGYWVATPLVLSSQPERAVLVLRGWLPRVFSDQGQPGAGHPPADDLLAPQGLQRIQGQLLSRIPRMYELWSVSDRRSVNHLPSTLPDPASPLPVVTNLALDDYAAATGLALLPAIVQQAQEASLPDDKLVREWAEPTLDADKNTGYALQWFGFAAIAAGAFLVIAWRALRRRRP